MNGKDFNHYRPVLSCDICDNPITAATQGFSNLDTVLCLACTERLAQRLKEVEGQGLESDEPIIVEEQPV